MLLTNLDSCRDLFHFKILGYVIMPDHWHYLLYFKVGHNCLAFIRDYKRFTSQEIVKILLKCNENNFLDYFKSKGDKKVKYTVWKEQARVIHLSSLEKIKSKLNYIHNNPVALGLVSSPDYYELSSANYYLNQIQGLITIDDLDLKNYVSGIVVPETQVKV